MKFFFDCNLSDRLARIAGAYDEENTVVHQRWDARFEPSSEDVEIIDALSKESPKPALVTADISQKKRPAERLALRESGLSVVFFKRGTNSLPIKRQIINLIEAWDDIAAQCTAAKAPTILEVGVNGKVENLGPVSRVLGR